ncbi:MAG: DUF6659 family protein [Candidatus Nitrosotenuis sp.]
MAKSLQHQFYDSKCKQLTSEKEIRFAGIIDEGGQLIAGGFKEGLTPLEDDEAKLSGFMEFASRISLRKEFDKTLGPINYIAARRDKLVLISFPFPVSKFVLLISAEPTVDIESLASKVVTIFKDLPSTGRFDFEKS